MISWQSFLKLTFLVYFKSLSSPSCSQQNSCPPSLQVFSFPLKNTEKASLVTEWRRCTNCYFPPRHDSLQLTLHRKTWLWLKNILIRLKGRGFSISWYYTIVTCNWFLYKQLRYGTGKMEGSALILCNQIVRSATLETAGVIKFRIFFACISLVEVPQRPYTIIH